MRNIYLILGIAAIATTACSKATLSEVPTSASEGTRLVFTATTDASEATKTTLGTGGVVNWTGTDQIQVNAGTKNETNTFTIKSCSGNEATFEGSVRTVGTEYYALYPASAFVKFDTGKGKIQFNVPAEQTACLGGFADNVNVAVAHTSGMNFAFKNVLSYVYFNLQENNVTKVAITGKNNESLAGGTCKMTVAVDEAPVQSDNPTTGYTTVSIGDGKTVLAKGVYYIALLPNKNDQTVNFTKGFTMTFTDNSGREAEKETDNALQIVRGAAKNLGTISDLSFSNTLEADKSSVNVSADAGSTTVNVTSSTSWTAEISGEGFSIDKTSGSGSGTITVSYTENTSTASNRSATLTITSSDTKLEPVTVSFTQTKRASAEAKTYEKDFGSYDGTAGTDGFFSWSGSKKSGINATTISGTTYNYGLKFDSSGKITFTAVKTGVVTLYVYSEKTVKFDGTASDAPTDNVIIINSVAVGEHTLTKGSGENTIFRIKFQED